MIIKKKKNNTNTNHPSLSVYFFRSRLGHRYIEPHGIERCYVCAQISYDLFAIYVFFFVPLSARAIRHRPPRSVVLHLVTQSAPSRSFSRFRYRVRTGSVFFFCVYRFSPLSVVRPSVRRVSFASSSRTASPTSDTMSLNTAHVQGGGCLIHAGEW